MDHLSTIELIGVRYLDTQHESNYLQAVEQELSRRKVVGPYRWALEYLAASAFWWNIVWWDEFNLSGTDIVIGWAFNLLAFCIPVGFVWHFIGGLPALGIFLLLHGLTARLGFKLRAGSVVQ